MVFSSCEFRSKSVIATYEISLRIGASYMNAFRRDFLKLAGTGLAGAATSAVIAPGARADVTAPIPAAGTSGVYDVRTYGATGDGKTIDSPAINKVVDYALFPGV